jgi:hypothetical protein
MKQFLALAAITTLVACQPATSEGEPALDNESAGEAAAPAEILAGRVSLTLREPVAEPRACILPIVIGNGTDSPVTVTMIGFAITGPGEDTTGNMFSPEAAPGETSEARVILEGQSCDAYDAVRVENIQCKSGGETCNDQLDYNDYPTMRFIKTG